MTQLSLLDAPELVRRRPTARPRKQRYPIAETSIQAANSISDRLNEMQAQVLAAITRAGAKGLTCDEAEEQLEMKHQTCSARFRELQDRDRIRPNGLRRPTRSGRNANVFVVGDRELA